MARSIIADGTRVHPHEFSRTTKPPLFRGVAATFFSLKRHALTVWHDTLFPTFSGIYFVYFLIPIKSGGELRSRFSLLDETRAIFFVARRSLHVATNGTGSWIDPNISFSYTDSSIFVRIYIFFLFFLRVCFVRKKTQFPCISSFLLLFIELNDKYIYVYIFAKTINKFQLLVGKITCWWVININQWFR